MAPPDITAPVVTTTAFTNAPATMKEANAGPKKEIQNFVRNKNDYYWMVGFAATYAVAGEYFFRRSNPEEMSYFYTTFNELQLKNVNFFTLVAAHFAVTSATMFVLTGLMWAAMIWWFPNTSRTHFWPQVKLIATNFLVLPAYQTVWDILTFLGYTKYTLGDLTPLEIVRDCCLWMLAFELAWYTQHRYMHDNKWLWKHGHSLHHTWRRPDQMIGITNFAFDHFIEGWVTMSSAFFPLVIFPINFWVGKALAFLYMLWAILVHLDAFPVKYHLDHHYQVVKNYGSHWPIYDIFFNTYHWGPKNKKN